MNLAAVISAKNIKLLMAKPSVMTKNLPMLLLGNTKALAQNQSDTKKN
jgi:hypothetical protein